MMANPDPMTRAEGREVCDVRSNVGTVGAVIGFLEGEALSERLVMTAGGVGYVVACPEPLTAGQRVRLHVTTVVREDAITCYGFVTVLDQRCFDALVSVPGVGPAMALSVLRHVGTQGVARAVAARDVAALKRAPGVGAKTAERIVLTISLPAEVADAAGDTSGESGLIELVVALEALGFDRAAAADAARGAVEEMPDGDEPLWLAGALSRLRAA